MKKTKMEKGITLVALIITIVILLILAAVAIAAIQNENILSHANNAALKYNQAVQNEQDILGGYLDLLEGKTSVKNPYDPDGWDLAWVCINGTWQDAEIAKGGTIPENANIVAKFYKTGNKITPPDLIFNGTTYTSPEGDEYKLVIEGQGDMGPLMATEGNNITGAYGWHTQTAMFMAGYAETCIMPYVTEAYICDGVTKIGGYALSGDTALSKVKISSTVTTIGDFAFAYCNSLTNITIPVGVTTIGYAAFSSCASLNNVTIPIGVTSIGEAAFVQCSALTSVTIPNSVTTIGESVW